jgi:hypothetical protein
MPQITGTRVCSWIVAICCLLTCGCFHKHLYDSGPADVVANFSNLTSGYPVGPISQQFTCFGKAHQYADALVNSCFGSQALYLANDTACMKGCPTATSSEDDLKRRRQCAAQCLEAYSEQNDWQNLLCDCSYGTCTKSCIDASLECTAATRNSYADFLNCREDFQTAAGYGIASLAAAGAAFAVGVSAVAGVALGGTAAAGLGLDYIAYSPAKTQAYANATEQLQCVLYDSSTLTHTWPQLDNALRELQGTLNQPLPLCTPYSIQPLLPQLCRVSDDEKLLYNDLIAEDSIAQQQACYAQASFNRVGRDIFATTRNIDVRAFAAAQNGIPGPNTIQTAMQAASTIPGMSPSAAKSANPAPQAFVPPGAEISLPLCSLDKAQVAAIRFRQILKQVQLPQPGFPDCIALSSNAPAPSGSPSTATSGNSGNPGGGGQNQNPSSAQKPVAVPFQVLPVTAPSTGGGGGGTVDLRTDRVQVPVSEKVGGTTVIKIVGGTPPYYAQPVPGPSPVASIIHETETDPFVSFQVQVPFPQKSSKATQQRVLFGDQAGSQQFVDLIPVTPTPTPTKTPTATVSATPTATKTP